MEPVEDMDAALAHGALHQVLERAQPVGDDPDFGVLPVSHRPPLLGQPRAVGSPVAEEGEEPLLASVVLAPAHRDLKAPSPLAPQTPGVGTIERDREMVRRSLTLNADHRPALPFKAFADLEGMVSDRPRIAAGRRGDEDVHQPGRFAVRHLRA